MKARVILFVFIAFISLSFYSLNKLAEAQSKLEDKMLALPQSEKSLPSVLVLDIFKVFVK